MAGFLLRSIPPILGPQGSEYRAAKGDFWDDQQTLLRSAMSQIEPAAQSPRQINKCTMTCALHKEQFDLLVEMERLRLISKGKKFVRKLPENRISGRDGFACFPVLTLRLF